MSLSNEAVKVLKLQAMRFEALYAATRAAHEALAPYASIGELFDATAFSSLLPAAPRRDVLLAIIAEQQKASHPLWQGLLIHAFLPMLRRLEESQQSLESGRTVLLFIEAVGRVPTNGEVKNVEAYLCAAVERDVVRSAKRVQAEPEMVTFDEDEHTTAHVETALISAIDLERVLERAKVAGDVVDAMTATAVLGESLREYVKRKYAATPERQHGAVYCKLLRERNGTVRRVRRRFGERPREIFDLAAE
jgi:hypothetical protein